MKIIILAAGTGSRLRPLTNDIPKCLVEIDGITLLELQLKIIKKCGLNDIIIVGGYQSLKLEKFGFPVIVNSKFETTNMVESLFCASKYFGSEMIVSYGDIVYSPQILMSLLGTNSEISIVIDDNWQNYWENRTENPLEDLESLKLNENGLIIEIGQKPRLIEEIQGQYIGLMKFSGRGIEKLSNVYQNIKLKGLYNGLNVNKAFMTDLLQQMIIDGHELEPLHINTPWVEIDTIKDFESKITKHRINLIRQSLKDHFFVGTN